MMTELPVGHRFPAVPNTLGLCNAVGRAKLGMRSVTATILATLLFGLTGTTTTATAQEANRNLSPEKETLAVDSLLGENRYQVLLRIIPGVPGQVSEFTDSCTNPRSKQAAGTDLAPQAEGTEEDGCFLTTLKLLAAFYRCKECHVSEGDVDVLLSFIRTRTQESNGNNRETPENRSRFGRSGA